MYCTMKPSSSQPKQLALFGKPRGKKKIQANYSAVLYTNLTYLHLKVSPKLHCLCNLDRRDRGRLGHEKIFLSTYQLGTAPYERQKLEVIQAPHALAASRFHPVGLLKFSHYFEVPETKERKKG